MTILEVDNPEIGKNVVQHPENYPGRGDIRYLGIHQEPHRNLYEHRRGAEHFHSRLVSDGYYSLMPVCDVEVIKNRQNVIKSFLNDFPGNQGFFPMLNMMHLIEEWANWDKSRGFGYSGEGFSSEKAGKVLRRYLDEADKLLDRFDEAGGTLRKVAESYREEMPIENIELLVKVCERGRFDSLVLERNRSDIRVIGIVGREAKKKDRRYLGQYDLKDQIGWSEDSFVKYGFREGVGMLRKFFAPLGFLYHEAGYVYRRREEGNRVCFPKINNQGLFEMVEGEPILDTPEPVAWRSFRFDEKLSKSILNGLHSGGKTHLLCDIPLYVLRGLMGLSLPASSAKIPLTRRIFYALHLDKQMVGGSLESEMKTRAQEIMSARKGDLFLIDEFLQHASPDAADPLEPIILEEYAKTKASFVIVDHRGESIDDGNSWRFWSPGFREEKGRVMPTYRFEQGKPSKEILMKHARQLLTKIKNELDEPEPGRKPYTHTMSNANGEFMEHWLKRIEERILEGEY